MKNLMLIIVAVILSFTTYAQQKTGWKEMDKFHELSNQTLHTAMAGNCQPIKQNSTALLDAAKNWQQSKAPKGCDTPKYKADLDELVKESRELDAAVKAGKPDEDLRTLADKTHKTFHVLLAETVINP